VPHGAMADIYIYIYIYIYIDILFLSIHLRQQSGEQCGVGRGEYMPDGAMAAVDAPAADLRSFGGVICCAGARDMPRHGGGGGVGK